MSAILKRVLIFFLLFILGLSFATASFDVKVNTIKNSIEENESAKFEVHITNELGSSDRYEFNFGDSLTWNVRSDPTFHTATEYGLELNPGETSNTTFFIKPRVKLLPNVYKVQMDITSKTTLTKKSEFLTVNYRPSEQPTKDYTASVKTKVSVPEKIDPREKALIEINLENRNRLNITKLNIKIRSKLINKDINTTLTPLEKKIEQIEVSFDPLQPPLNDTLTVTVSAGNITFKPLEQSYEIVAYSVVNKEEKSKKGFLRREQKITLINLGNENKTETIKVGTSFLRSLFTRTEPKGEIKKIDGKRYFVWKIDLSPSQTFDVNFAEDYKAVTAIILLIILVVVLYFIFRSPAVITKDVTKITSKEGGISGLKVLINVKNRSNKSVPAVTVIDRVPNIAEVEDEAIMGTIKPTKISKHEKKGATIEWKIPALEPLEERVISYKLKSKLSILGGFSLPSAILKFKDKKGRTLVVHSNGITVGAKNL